MLGSGFGDLILVVVVEPAVVVVRTSTVVVCLLSFLHLFVCLFVASVIVCLLRELLLLLSLFTCSCCGASCSGCFNENRGCGRYLQSCCCCRHSRCRCAWSCKKTSIVRSADTNIDGGFHYESEFLSGGLCASITT